MFGMAPFGEFAIGQISPVNDPPLVNGVRLPLYTQGRQSYPQTQPNYWIGTQNTYPGG